MTASFCVIGLLQQFSHNLQCLTAHFGVLVIFLMQFMLLVLTFDMGFSGRAEVKTMVSWLSCSASVFKNRLGDVSRFSDQSCD